MKLNRAQLLVHDDRAMEKFRVIHGILTDVTIERPGPNDVPRVSGDNLKPHPSVRQLHSYLVCSVDTMQILDKFFSAEDLLHVYTVVRPNNVPSNPFYEGNHYLRLRNPVQPKMSADNCSVAYVAFNDRFKCHSDEYKKAIRATNNRQESRDVDALLAYKLHYRHKILHRTADLVRAILCPLSIESQAPKCDAFIPEKPKAEPNTHSLLQTQHSYDLVHVPPQLMRKVELVWSKLRKGAIGGTAQETLIKIGETSSTAAVELWKPEFSAFELDKQVMVADSAQDHNTSMAFARAVMLPNNVAALFEEDTETMRSLLVMQNVQQKRAKKKKGNLESELKKSKLALTDVDQLKVDLDAAEQAQDASYAATP
ncbi:hypothetical protein Acr_23g0004260 [Actinidia rufa]|uniref:Uncharacterized protein n=1 Tax=Actinidia rufa TaxID=165716 RepID=A0A7J0GMR4_9ERIC|nr:hypothetical protein Acr_23g0004260 [Actinidia rufa]